MGLIYLDNNSTTRLAPEVFEAMLPYLADYYGNASSNHSFGKLINKAVQVARMQIAKLIDCDHNEVIFTAGATESINLAIKGVAEHNNNQKRHIITVETEHTAVLDVCYHLENYGYEVTYLPVNQDGVLSIADLRNALRPDTALVAVMIVNNETGVIQPIQEISELVHDAGGFVYD